MGAGGLTVSVFIAGACWRLSRGRGHEKTGREELRLLIQVGYGQRKREDEISSKENEEEQARTRGRVDGGGGRAFVPSSHW